MGIPCNGCRIGAEHGQPKRDGHIAEKPDDDENADSPVRKRLADRKQRRLEPCQPGEVSLAVAESESAGSPQLTAA
jgi:hypothetical protein